MTGDAEALARRVYAALGAGDRDALGELLADDFEAAFCEGLPVGGGEHHGAEATIRDGWWALGRAFAVAADPVEWIGCEDGRLLVRGRYRGPVAGGGLGLLWCADVVLAADDLRLVGAFGRLGLTNDGGSSWWLPRLVGLRRAQELLLTARRLDAAEALEWGLVTRVLPGAELDAAALTLARELAAGPTVALGHQRRLLRESFDRTLGGALAEEKRTIMACGATADADEGIGAFAERRPPRFEGR